MGPIQYDKSIHNAILSSFNEINTDIKFTMEAPEPHVWLPFLDIKFRFTNGHLRYSWFTKQCHSGNALHATSHHTGATKRNYLFNDILRVLNRCSDKNLEATCIMQAKAKYETLGYSNRDINQAMRRAIYWKPNSRKIYDATKPVLKLPFVSDKATRLIKNHIKRSNFDINLVIRHGPKVMSVLSHTNSSSEKCDDACHLCTLLPTHIGCNTKNVVYQYKCQLCSQTYIGYSARCLKHRHAEHKRSIHKGDDVSALSMHLKHCHNSVQPHTIDNYDISVIQHCRDAVSASLAENYHIQHLKPHLNRKHEGIVFNYV